MDLAIASGYSQVRCWIDWLANMTPNSNGLCIVVKRARRFRASRGSADEEPLPRPRLTPDKEWTHAQGCQHEYHTQTSRIPKVGLSAGQNRGGARARSTARLAQIRADLIAGNGPYLRKDAPIRPSPDDKLVRLCFEFLDVAARLAHYRRAPSAR
jgi:hypothetical protein